MSEYQDIHDRACTLSDQLMLHGLVAERIYRRADDMEDENNPELQADLQAAIAASLADTGARSPGAGPSGTRTSEEAGIASTPNSSRAHRK